MIVSVAPSYWADVPGQFKAFIDRCTPWSNTHEPHASLGGGKRGGAMELLAKVGVMDGGTGKLQWSVVYNLTELSGSIFAHHKTENAVQFELNR